VDGGGGDVGLCRHTQTHAESFLTVVKLRPIATAAVRDALCQMMVMTVMGMVMMVEFRVIKQDFKTVLVRAGVEEAVHGYQIEKPVSVWVGGEDLDQVHVMVRGWGFLHA